MRNLLWCCAAFCLTGALAGAWAAPATAADDGFQTIFDGKTLDGWAGKPQFWSVKDGCITGQTTADNPTKGNTFIVWRGGKLADFELQLKFRMVGGNSGIQYRSTEMDDFVVGGYQGDIDAGFNFIGILYEERGRGILVKRTQKMTIAEDGKKAVAEEKTCDEKAFLASLKKEDWNDFTIIAQGPHLVQKINGFTTIEVTDCEKDKSKAEGVLALQLHAGPPMLVQFKDIRIKKL